MKVRYIPENSQSITRKNLPAVVYTYTTRHNCPAFVAYKGTSAKPYDHRAISNPERMEKEINLFFASVEADEEYKNARRNAKSNLINDFQIGDILHSSWGYDQTNASWYQVTSKTAKTITFRQICASESYDRMDCGSSLPCKDDFRESSENGLEPMTRKINALVYPNGNIGETYVKINSFAIASKWDGLPANVTRYA